MSTVRRQEAATEGEETEVEQMLIPEVGLPSEKNTHILDANIPDDDASLQ